MGMLKSQLSVNLVTRNFQALFSLQLKIGQYFSAFLITPYQDSFYPVKFLCSIK